MMYENCESIKRAIAMIDAAEPKKFAAVRIPSGKVRCDKLINEIARTRRTEKIYEGPITDKIKRKISNGGFKKVNHTMPLFDELCVELIPTKSNKYSRMLEGKKRAVKRYKVMFDETPPVGSKNPADWLPSNWFNRWFNRFETPTFPRKYTMKNAIYRMRTFNKLKHTNISPAVDWDWDAGKYNVMRESKASDFWQEYLEEYADEIPGGVYKRPSSSRFGRKGK